MKRKGENQLSPINSKKLLFVLTIALAAGFLLCGYEFIRSSSSSIYLDVYGKDKLPYAMLGGATFTIIFLYIYGWLITLIGARRTLLVTSLFSSVVIVLIYFAVKSGISISAWVLYSFREAYVVIIIEQYWSLINSTLKEDQAKKFNGPITGFGSIGAIIGGFTVGFAAQKIHTEPLLLLTALSLLPAALCSELAYRFGGEPAPSIEEKGKKSLAISLFKDSSYLRRIALLIFLTQIISTVLDLRFSGLVQDFLPIKDERTAYLGMFYGRLNLIAGILQFVVAPILLSFVSFRFIHPSIPMIHIATAVILFVKPNLFTGGLAYLVFKAFDYSIFRASKEIFYMPLSFDSRYRAKEVIDAFGYRASKGISAGLTSFATMISGFFGYMVSGGAYPITAAISAIIWLLTVTGLVKQHDRILKQSDKQDSFLNFTRKN
jgi:AAA family ATP:ADP antiporter